MRGLLLLALAFLAPVAAASSVPPPPGDPKAPVKLVSFAARPSSIACAGALVRLVEGAAPPAKVWQVWAPPAPPVGTQAYVPPPPPSTEVYSFSIDADGQVIDLKRASTPGVTVVWPIDEQAAIIASWRFAPGAPAKGCTIDLAPRYAPIAEASPAQLFAALANDARTPSPPLRKALAAGNDCDGPTRRRPRTIVYPDLRPFDDKTVDPAWAGLRFDIDAAGAARNVRVVAQHGEAAFADAAASAVAEAKYFPGPPRAGCAVAFKAMPKATPPPKRVTPPVDDDACKITQAELNLPETKFFPPAFGKRRVGGRAVLRFDVAPWGQIGAVEVLEAQPAAAFGEAARMLLTSGRPKAPPTGYRGCVVPIVYAIPAIPEDEY